MGQATPLPWFMKSEGAGGGEVREEGGTQQGVGSDREDLAFRTLGRTLPLGCCG